LFFVRDVNTMYINWLMWLLIYMIRMILVSFIDMVTNSHLYFDISFCIEFRSKKNSQQFINYFTLFNKASNPRIRHIATTLMSIYWCYVVRQIIYFIVNVKNLTCDYVVPDFVSLISFCISRLCDYELWW
jgi:hypothetical protein